MFGLLGAAFGTQWPLIERWAGRAGLLIAGILALIGLAVLKRAALKSKLARSARLGLALAEAIAPAATLAINAARYTLALVRAP
jgi:hypothetical protein